VLPAPPAGEHERDRDPLKKGHAFRVQWTGTTNDVNHYDGSKPTTRVEIEGHVHAGEDGIGKNVGHQFEGIMAENGYYSRDGAIAGPVSALAMKQLASNGQLAPTDLVWKGRGCASGCRLNN